MKFYAIATNVDGRPAWIILHQEWFGFPSFDALDGDCLTANRETVERELISPYRRFKHGTIIEFSVNEIQPVGEH